MSDLRQAAQLALEFVTSEAWGKTPYMDVCVYEDAARLRDALSAALAQQPEPVQEPVAWRYQDARGNYRYRGYVQGFDNEYSRLKPVPLYTAPLQRPPLTVQDLQQALVDTGLIFPEAIDDAEGFDHGVTLERIDKLHLLLVGVGS